MRFTISTTDDGLTSWISRVRPGFVFWTYNPKRARTFTQEQIDDFLPRLQAKFPAWVGATITPIPDPYDAATEPGKVPPLPRAASQARSAHQ